MTQEGREGVELSSITSWSKIWDESVSETMQIDLVTNQAVSQDFPLVHALITA